MQSNQSMRSTTVKPVKRVSLISFDQARERGRQTDALFLQAIKNYEQKVNQLNGSTALVPRRPETPALATLAELVAHADDTVVVKRVKPVKNPITPWPTTENPYTMSELRSPLTQVSPLAAIEAAIIQHVSTCRMLPDTIYVSSQTYKLLELQHQRVKFSPFDGRYRYFTGSEVVVLHVKTERAFPRWHVGIDRDQVFCSSTTL